MHLFTPEEIVRNYARAGKAKAEKPAGPLLLLAVLAGFCIAFGAAAVNTAAHAVENVSAARIISGLLFPLGLGTVMLLGAELFTGNVMIGISVLDGQTSAGKMLRNWVLVYFGNFAGALLLAAGGAWFGQLDYSGGGLGAYTIQVAAAKCEMPFQNAFVLGVFCNILVCAGVLCSLSAQDTAGRILGAYIPVALFVICGFEHCVANMYYVPAGMFAARVPEYAALAAKAGADLRSLTWGNFLLHNLAPVTLGNILGGGVVGGILWAGYGRPARKTA